MLGDSLQQLREVGSQVSKSIPEAVNRISGLFLTQPHSALHYSKQSTFNKIDLLTNSNHLKRLELNVNYLVQQFFNLVELLKEVANSRNIH